MSCVDLRGVAGLAVACMLLACVVRTPSGNPVPPTDEAAGDPGADVDQGDLLPPNAAPVLAPVADQAVDEGSTLNLQLAATDADDDPLTFGCAVNCPPGLSVAAASGLGEFTPGYDQAGTFADVQFRVSDGKATVLGAPVTIRVRNVIHYQGWVGGLAGGGVTSGWTLGGTSLPGAAEGAFNGPVGVAADSVGNRYVADLQNDRVVELDAGGLFLGWWGARLSDGLATGAWVTGDLARPSAANGGLSSPAGLAIDVNDRLHIVDADNRRVSIVEPSGSFVRQIVGTGANAGTLLTPRGVAVDQAMNVYVADSAGQRLERFDDTGAFTGWLGGLATQQVTNGWSMVDAVSGGGSGDGMFASPSDLAVASTGELYVADALNHRIQHFDGLGVFQDWLGKRSSDGQLGWHTGDVPISGSEPGAFNIPIGLFVTAADELYVADRRNARIQVLALDGTVLRVLGNTGTGNALLKEPLDVVVDSAGNTYVLDPMRICRYDAADAFGGWIGGDQSTGLATDGWYLGTDTPATGTGPGQFMSATGVALDDARHELYVPDYDNGRVQIFDLTDAGRYADELAVQATASVVIDDVNNEVFVATALYEIHVFDRDTHVLERIIGGQGTGLGEFAIVTGMTVVGGRLYVGERSPTVGGNRLQRLELDGTPAGWIGKLASVQVAEGWHSGDAPAVSNLPGGFVGIWAVAVDPDGLRLFATDVVRDEVTVFSLASGRVISRFAVWDRRPAGVAVGPEDGQVYVSHTSGFTVYDGTTYDEVVRFGSSGTGDAQLRNGQAVVFAGQDLIVVDADNGRLQKW